MDARKVLQAQNEQKQLDEFMLSNLPADLKTKIAERYKELCIKHPEWKKHRAMRKAGEAYHIKFIFKND